jgi:pyruvate dehydrogenase E1 component alpha subunit
LLTQIFEKAKFCRAFEQSVFDHIKSGDVKVPTYLSAGQELISATISTICESMSIKPMLFAQHRAHSTYLSFGGDPQKLIDELLGLPTGCAKGMGGSASIHSPEIQMYGHDGLMGSNAPIAVGACYASKKPTIVFLGDASAEEDYALASYGWAGTKNLPILFVVEDNNLSILTEKKVRRNWDIYAVAEAMNIESYEVEDINIDKILDISDNFFKRPMLLEISTERLFWHAGAGMDGSPRDLLKNTDLSVYKEKIEQLWKNRLEQR